MRALVEAVVGREPWWQVPALHAPAGAAPRPAGATDGLPAPLALAFFAGFSALLGLWAATVPAVEFMQRWVGPKKAVRLG